MSISKPNNIADWASILTPAIIIALGFYGNSKLNEAESHSDADVAALKQSITESYEKKSEHDSDINQIKQQDQIMEDKQTEISISIQKIADREHIDKN